MTDLLFIVNILVMNVAASVSELELANSKPVMVPQSSLQNTATATLTPEGSG
jgi:hypothetical protein